MLFVLNDLKIKEEQSSLPKMYLLPRYLIPELMIDSIVS